MNEKKEYFHLMPDDKFLDYYIALSEAEAPGQSQYWVKKQKNDTKLNYIKSPLVRAVAWDDAREKKSVLDLANSAQKVFLHSFSLSDLSFVKGLKNSITLIWIFWGLEGYRYKTSKRKLYLPHTLKVYYQSLRKDVSFVRYWFRRWKLRQKEKRESDITGEILKRVNICATWVSGDFDLIHPGNPDLGYSYFSYFSIEQLGLEKLERTPADLTRIWIGNSASETNNHADALLRLKELDWRGEIVMPLSYNAKPFYRDYILKLGSSLFGSKFRPLLDFMPLNEYQNLINSCGIVWMNHIRQQAAGNCLAALYTGKVLIMNSNNSLMSTFLTWGLKIYESDILLRLNEVDAVALENNRKILPAQISIEKNLHAVREFYKSSPTL